MAAATDVFGFVTDALSDYVSHNGSSALQGVFQWAGNASSTFGVYLEENPVQAATAMTVGLFAVAALGPEAVTATAVESLAGVLETRLSFLGITSTTANAIATAAINALTEQTGEAAVKATDAIISTISNALGGSAASISVASSTNIPPSNSSSNPNIIVAAAPDSSGNTDEILVNLPTLSQDANTTSVVTANNSAMASGSPAYQTDQYTGSTITFTGSDDQTHTGTILYKSSSGLGYVVDNVSGQAPGTPYAGEVGVGNGLVISITPPSGSSPQVVSSQITNNSDGSQTDQNFGSNGSVQYTETDNTSSSGAISSTITGNGDITSLSDASISLAADAAATVAARCRSGTTNKTPSRRGTRM